MSIPKLSVLVVADDDQRLQLSLDSLYAQGLTDFELIMVADALSDFTHDVLKKACEQWRPSRLLFNSYNIGKAGSWNRGLLVAQGGYVAIQYPTAISLPSRLQKQKDFLDHNPLIDMVGSNAVHLVGQKDEEIGFLASLPVDTLAMHQWIRANQISPILGASLMFRRAVVLGYGGFSEDTTEPVFDLICRLLSFNCNAANIEEPLVKCRVEPCDTGKSREIAAKFRRRNLGVPKLSADKYSGPTFSEWEF